MTDNQIVMLMERCYKKEESVVITQFNSDNTKTEITLDDILGVINRLQADKEALIAGQETLQKALAEKNAEIERLQKLLDDKCDRCIAKERDGAIKEFAERLKKKLPRFGVSLYSEQTVFNDIDNLVKEMVGDAE